MKYAAEHGAESERLEEQSQQDANDDKNSLGSVVGTEQAMLLTCIHRDLISTLLPELQSVRAKNIAAMMGVLLRHLIWHEDHPKSRRTYLNRASELASKIAERAPTPDNSVTRLQGETESNFAELIDHAITTLFEQHRTTGSIDEIALSTMIEAELDYIECDGFEAPNGGAASGEHGLVSITLERLTAYLQSRFPDKGLKVASVKPTQGGYSKDVFIVECEEREQREQIVIRRDRLNGAIETPRLTEYALLKALHRKGILVPEPLWVEEREILGLPFLVMRWVPGRPVTNSFTMPANEESLNACRWLAEFLARLHKLDVRTLPVPLGEASMSTADYVLRYITDWEQVWKRRRTETSIILTIAFKWLVNNIPRNVQRPVLVHGDPSFTNVMINDGQVTAMLDWECAHVGHPAEDLGSCRLWVESVMDWDDFLRHYRDSGGDAEDHSRFFAIMYLARGAVITAANGAEFAGGAQRDLKAAYAGVYFYRLALEMIAKELSSAGWLHH